jgi:hypothetical protein
VRFRLAAAAPSSAPFPPAPAAHAAGGGHDVVVVRSGSAQHPALSWALARPLTPATGGAVISGRALNLGARPASAPRTPAPAATDFGRR